MIVRIFNPNTTAAKTRLFALGDKINMPVKLLSFEIKTFKIELVTNKIIEVNGIE